MTGKRNGNLLLVDDEKELLQQLANILTIRGFNVICASGGREAFELITKRRNRFGSSHIGAVVSDWMMYEGNGLELLAKIRSSSDDEAIPFVLMSGAVTPEKLTEAIILGADSVILKPFETNSLVKKIDEAIKVRLEKVSNRSTKPKVS